MRYKLLGRSGLRVSELGLGAMTFGEEWGFGAPKAESQQIFEAFVEAGGNFVDTANTYSNGTSETYLGEFVKPIRDRIVLASKYSNTVSTGNPNAGGNSRKTMVEALNGSLRRLNTDYIDLYWLHIWDFMTPIEEVLRAFDDLVRAGKVLYIGISDTPAWIVSRANAISELRGWTEFVGLQIEYSLVARTPERELLPMARELGIGVTAWSPLAGGLLSGKYSRSVKASSQGRDSSVRETGNPGDNRLDNPQWTAFWPRSDRNLGIAAEVVRIAEEVGRAPAQVALNWLRAQDVIPIIGARTAGQLAEDLGCLDFTLRDEQVHRLSEASRVELGFPHDFYQLEMIRSLVYAGTFDRIDACLGRRYGSTSPLRSTYERLR
jgi:aryl-alcohol dehydrogenase-like predicted oxidoreductase